MDEKILQQFIKELQNIVQNKPLSEEFQQTSFSTKELETLKEGFQYLAHSLLESYQFLINICQGNLNTPSPSRNNFFIGPLKELQAVLNHLTWQTIQVANGDYSQHIDYLGDFSTYFNAMIQQLQERESLLKEQTQALNQSLSLFKLITNAQDDWVLVLDISTKKFVYTNNAAKAFFFTPDTQRNYCAHSCPLLTKLLSFTTEKKNFHFEYFCKTSNSYIFVKGFPCQWNHKETIVYYLKDITIEREKKELLRDIAYHDTLTKIYNRRYFIEYMNNLPSNQSNYSIISIDVDGLKYVNDTFGHNRGDDYLCTVVSTIQKHIRSTDLFCRFGGDEFLLLLPDCIEEIATSKMEAVNSELIALKKEYPLSVSYGILYITKENTMDLPEILNTIDQKMYVYKKLHKQSRANAKKENTIEH